MSSPINLTPLHPMGATAFMPAPRVTVTGPPQPITSVTQSVANHIAHHQGCTLKVVVGTPTPSDAPAPANAGPDPNKPWWFGYSSAVPSNYQNRTTQRNANRHGRHPTNAIKPTMYVDTGIYPEPEPPPVVEPFPSEGQADGI